MKFYNKKKEYRKTWTVVDVGAISNPVEMKRWCQNNGSADRFYFRGTPEISDMLQFKVWSWKWYFESPQDATVFRLIWKIR